MNQKLAYVPCGDYFIPNIKLSQIESHTLGKYGRMRRIFLEQNKTKQNKTKQNKTMLFNDMVLTETLFAHLWEVQQTCEKRMELLMEELLLKNPAPDKETQQLIWVQHMNTLKSLAEEVVVRELIYC